MNPEQKFALLRMMHEAHKTKAAETEAALLKHSATLTQALDQILSRNGGTPAPEPEALP